MPAIDEKMARHINCFDKTITSLRSIAMSAAPDFNVIALSTVYEISKVLSSSLVLNETLRQTLNIIATHLNMHCGMVSLVQDSGHLSTVASVGLSADQMQRAEFKLGEGITGRIFRHGFPAVIPDIATEPLFLNKTGLIKSLQGQSIAFLGVPIKVGAECIGVLSFRYIQSQEFQGFQPKLQLLTMVAGLIGQTVQLNHEISSERQQLMQEKSRLQKDLANKYQLSNVIGSSKRMQEVFADVHIAAPSNSTILLRGESGTGKEVIARAIHYLSPRKDAPFIKINCAALTESLLESELFGHEKGAFTGALTLRKGRFEQADGGTLFLDEIGDISPAFQLKLLRVLQESEFERVGGNKTIRVNVRLICATNRNLEEDVRQGKFRADLYFRINVISIHLPPLRERKDDIPLLVQHVMRKYNTKNNTKIDITREAMAVLTNCYWPGNIRELENCITRFCTMSKSQLIHDYDIPCQNNDCLSTTLWHQGAQKNNNVKIPIHHISTELNKNHVSDIAQPHGNAREKLIDAMDKSGWVQAKAARLLNLTSRQLAYALKKYEIEIKKF
jgi:Nif-specific regulatory protein